MHKLSIIMHATDTSCVHHLSAHHLNKASSEISAPSVKIFQPKCEKRAKNA